MNRLSRTTRIPLGFFLLFSCCLIRVDASPAPPSPKDAYSHDAKSLVLLLEAFCVVAVGVLWAGRQKASRSNTRLF